MRCIPLGIALLPLTVLWCGAAAADIEHLPDRVEGHSGGRFSLVARGTTLADVAEALAVAAECRCRVDEKLRDQPMTLELAPRSLERLARALARDASAQLSVSYLLEPIPTGRTTHPGRWFFARDLIQLEGPMPKPIEVAAAELGVPVEVAQQVRGKVNLPLTARPLGEMLDAMARQTRSRWVVVLTFAPTVPSVDASAAESERMHQHLNELAQLPLEDRRAEIADELQRLERLPTVEREAGVRRLAADIVSLGKLLHRVPGEHRIAVGGQVLPLARDYQHVLAGLPSSRQRTFRLLLGALLELDGLLRTAW